MSIIKLLKDSGHENATAYYNMVVESFINGQRSQGIGQFHALPRKERIEFLQYCAQVSWDDGNDAYHSALQACLTAIY